MKHIKTSLAILFLLGCTMPGRHAIVNGVDGVVYPGREERWLTHEHILVDFSGADSTDPRKWNHDSVINVVSKYLDELQQYGVKYFVDATPAYLGRDVGLLQKLTRPRRLTIITNTGLYGARKNKYIPSYAFDLSAEELSKIWVGEFKNGIDGTTIKPGFIKISVDAAETLDPMHAKLVRAAALTHLKTGLLILSHTGEAKGLWPQLKIVREERVSPEAFVWVHAQVETNNENYLRAAKEGCWIGLDGLGWEIEKHVEKLVFAKQHNILNRILISHDAGWYDPNKSVQEVRPYSDIFTRLLPELKSKGFTDSDINLLLSENPAKAFAIRIRKL